MKRVVLCVLDGWGVNERDEIANDALSVACKPFYDYTLRNYSNSKLKADGLDVGVSPGQVGNSEVGHFTIGAGRVVQGSLVRANCELDQLNFNEEISRFVRFLKEAGSTCNLIGLLSDGGVHSHLDHIKKFVDYFREKNINVNLHMFLDGRDVPPKSALQYIFDGLSIKTISGRYYGMDRDRRFERTDRAFFTILKGINGSENNFNSAVECVQFFYKKGVSDEFIEPSVIGKYNGIKENDGVLFCNFRADRVNQLLSKFKEYEQKMSLSILGLVQYSIKYPIKSILPEIKTNNTLGETLSLNKIKQLRLAETEKFAHVTYFFNAKREKPFIGEDRILVNSPKVATYDLKPEMSAFEVTEALIQNYSKYQFILVNYANADMVGHTGNFDAAIKAVETIDVCLQKIYNVLMQDDENDNSLIITADHGNVECMYDKKIDQPHTAHTNNRVPFILINKKLKNIKLRDGGLQDIAATILALFEIEKVADITGENLIV